MKEKFLEKKGFIVSLILGILDAVAIFVTIYGPDGKVKTTMHVIAFIGLATLAIIIIMYLIAWFQVGINKGKVLEKILEIESKIDNFKESLDDGLKYTNRIDGFEQNIETLIRKNDQIQMNIEDLKTDSQKEFCPVTTSSYVESSEDVNLELYRLLKDKKRDIKEIHIICFGRNGFGGAVKEIIRQRLDIKVKIIVFNPGSHPDICRKGDEIKINENIEEWMKGAKQIEIIRTEIPPMVRAAVAYVAEKDGALHGIWGSIQSYRFAFNPETKEISLEKPSNSLISICEERKTVTGDLHTLIKSFEEEFKRLEEYSQIAKVIKKPHGKFEIVYEENKHE